VSFFHRHPGLAPYLLLVPGLAWLAVFFVVPMYYLGYTSLQTGDVASGYSFSWAWDNYADAFTLYGDHFVRSLEYAGLATLAAFLIGYPLAYWIAFRGGRWKSVLLVLVIAPFFVTYLIRTLAWQTILADQGPVVGLLRDVGLLADDGRLLATTTAVVAGITYNFLPFMVLPLYVSLESIDRRLIEAAQDLYASRVKAFLRVTFPLSLPGLFAGTLLTFIPAAGDFINAELLGTPRQQMIGNVIQSKFREIADYPQAAALSFVLMGTILVAIVVYVRAIGSDRAMERAL
jgi:spermidine/putrescine transport system permease protein